MKRPSSAFRIYFLAGIMVLAFAGLTARLWYVQVARGSEYTARIRSGSQVTVRIPAVRGEILDRNGIPLVQNRVSFDVDFYLPDMVKAYRETHGKTPQTTYRGTVHNMPRDLKEADVVKIVSEEIIPRMEDLGVAEDYNSKRLQVHFRTNREVPFNYRQDLDFDSMAVLSERSLGLPGVTVTKKPVRHYVYGSMAAHILGYVGPPENLEKLPDIRSFNFYDPDTEGKAQIELSMNEYLKGKPGVRILQRNAKGVIEGEVSVTEPKQGDNVYLTLDARIQYIVENALRSVGRGAAVVVDVNTGDILAMASVPSFDPNTFIPSIKTQDWVALNQDTTKPIDNRAIMSFAPGSTYKVPIALAGLRAGVPTTFPCGGGISIGNTFMKCHSNKHGTFRLEDALKVSCNGFFYRYGIATDIEDIDYMGNLLGLGQKSGLPLSGESPGILPSKEYLQQHYPRERWTTGYTANTSIGQGLVLATPLQMAMVAATVANGGTVYYPRLIDKIVSQDGEIVLQEPAKVRANLLTDGGLTPEQIERVRQGMWKVVNEGGGTAMRARVKDVEVAGKTGTAQFSFRGVKDNRVWFISFAPYNNPRYAVSVMVEGAESGGRVAAPIAGKILEEVFKLDQPEAEPIQLAALAPAVGHSTHINEINFGRPVPAALAEGDINESVDVMETQDPNRSDAPVAAPAVREDADERGRVKNKERKPSGIQKFFNFLGGGDRKEKQREKSKSNPPGRR